MKLTRDHLGKKKGDDIIPISKEQEAYFIRVGLIKKEDPQEVKVKAPTKRKKKK